MHHRNSGQETHVKWFSNLKSISSKVFFFRPILANSNTKLSFPPFNIRLGVQIEWENSWRRHGTTQAINKKTWKMHGQMQPDRKWNQQWYHRDPKKILASSFKPANIRPFTLSEQPANKMTETQWVMAENKTAKRNARTFCFAANTKKCSPAHMFTLLWNPNLIYYFVNLNHVIINPLSFTET